MNIELLRHSDLNINRWNQRMMEFPNGRIYGMSWYLDACCPDWSAYIAGDYEYLFPVHKSGVPGFPAFRMPLFVQQLGLYGFNPDVTVWTAFLTRIQKDFKSVDIYLNSSCPSGLPFTCSERNSQIIPYVEGLTDTAAHYSQNLRRNLVKARKSGAVVECKGSVEVLVNEFEQQAGKRSTSLRKSQYEMLVDLLNTLSAHATGEVRQVLDADGNLLATGFFAQWKDTVLYVKGSSTEAGRSNGGMHFLMDFSIQKALDAGLHFDFGGAEAEAVRKFNTQFGAQNFTYYRLYKPFKLF